MRYAFFADDPREDRASVGGYTMWISFFTVALVIAIGLGMASLLVEANTKSPRRLVRRRISRARG